VKYIPEAEWNVVETIQTNVQGSINVALAARAAGVAKAIGISTDKACAPLNTYGMTKALMERIFAEANRRGGTLFGTVRYGNVVGSTGSVIPVFLRQLEESGRIKVTDDRMTRFWLSPSEAIDLIINCAHEIEKMPGITLVGANPAMRIVNLAQAVYQVWLREASAARRIAAGISIGNPPAEAPVDFTGIRPGEKLHESLFNEQEAPRAYRYASDSASARDIGYVIVPPTAVLPDGAMPAPAIGYSSNAPRRWIEVEEMANLIMETRSI
jgi:UDP-N-acetylglucosamine 4,6-dehydratase